MWPLEAMVDGATASEPSGATEEDPNSAEDMMAAEGPDDGADGPQRSDDIEADGDENDEDDEDGRGGGGDEDDEDVEAAFPPWIHEVLPLLRDGYAFEAIGVGGLDAELSQLFRRVVTPRLLPSRLQQALNLQLVRGVLLHGPPGTGKTLTARKIGKLLHVPEERTTVVDGPALVSKFLGESEKNLRDIFAPAVEEQQRATRAAREAGSSPSLPPPLERLHVVIFDEIDAICRARGHTDQTAGLVYDSLVNQLLSILDGVTPLDNVLVIGMTNRKDLIDPALLRPGRFEVELSLTLPTLEGREQILRIHTRRLRERRRLDPGVALDAIARETAAFSGASLAGLVKSATSRALARLVAALPDGASTLPSTRLQVAMPDFRDAIKELRSARGLTHEQLRKYRGPMYRHSDAFVEAWGAAVALAAPLATPPPLGEPGPSAAEAGSAACRRHRRRRRRRRRRPPRNHHRRRHLATSPSAPRGRRGPGATTFAAHLAAHCNFSYVGVLSADELAGAPEAERLDKLAKLSDGAHASDTSVIVIDDIERLLGHVTVGSVDGGTPPALAASPLLLEAMLAVLRNKPPAGCSLLVLGTTSAKPLLGRTALLSAFDSAVALPPLEAPEGVHSLLHLAGAAATPAELQEMAMDVPIGATLKQVVRAIELSRVPSARLGAREAAEAAAAAAAAAGDIQEEGRAQSTTQGSPPPAPPTIIDHPQPTWPVDRARFAQLMRHHPIGEERAAAARAQQTALKVVNTSEELLGQPHVGGAPREEEEEEEEGIRWREDDGLVVDPGL